MMTVLLFAFSPRIVMIPVVQHILFIPIIILANCVAADCVFYFCYSAAMEYLFFSLRKQHDE